MTTTAPSPVEGGPVDFEELARRVDELRDTVRHTDEHARELLEETIEAVTAFNRAGLVTLVQLLREDPRGEQLLFDAVDHPEVMALFVAHGIVKVDKTLDVLRAVDQIRPYLAASAIEMEVVQVDGETAYVRFNTGCDAPAAQTKEEIRDLIRTRSGLRAVEEVVDQPQAFVPLTSLTIGRP